MAKLFFAAAVLAVSTILLEQTIAKKGVGQVKCMGSQKIPDAKLIQSFLKANCKLPKKFTLAAQGAIARCVLEHEKIWKNKGDYDPKEVVTLLTDVFPDKYKAGLEQTATKCINTHMPQCENKTNDKKGKTWEGLMECFDEWWNKKLCK